MRHLAERKGKTCHGETGAGIHFSDGFDSVFTKDGLDVLFVFCNFVFEKDGLRGSLILKLPSFFMPPLSL